MHCNFVHGERFAALPRPVRFLLVGLMGLAFAACLVTVFGLVTMWLWNAVIPGISSLPAIGFWQAVGVLVLARLLTGRFSHGPHGHRHRFRHRHERGSDPYEEWWDAEGEDAFRAYYRHRQGRQAPPDGR
jgi:hypothetical protein